MPISLSKDFVASAMVFKLRLGGWPCSQAVICHIRNEWRPVSYAARGVLPPCCKHCLACRRSHTVVEARHTTSCSQQMSMVPCVVMSKQYSTALFQSQFPLVSDAGSIPPISSTKRRLVPCSCIASFSGQECAALFAYDSKGAPCLFRAALLLFIQDNCPWTVLDHRKCWLGKRLFRQRETILPAHCCPSFQFVVYKVQMKRAC